MSCEKSFICMWRFRSSGRAVPSYPVRLVILANETDLIRHFYQQDHLRMNVEPFSILVGHWMSSGWSLSPIDHLLFYYLSVFLFLSFCLNINAAFISGTMNRICSKRLVTQVGNIFPQCGILRKLT